MAENNKEKGLKSKERALIKFCIGALVLLGGYLAGTQIFAPKTEKINKNNVILEKEVKELEDANKNKVNIQKDLDKMENEIESIIKKYPSDFTFEKLTEFITKTMNKKFKFAMEEISYVDNGEFYTFVDSSGVENSSGEKIYSATVKIKYSAGYDELKKIIKFINEDISTKVTISEINSKSNKEGSVVATEGNITFVVYYGMSKNKYEEPEFDVSTGNKQIFYK